jgi:hypothetical protein
MLREVQQWVALPDQDHLRDHRNQPLGVVLTWGEGKRLIAHMVAGRKLLTWMHRAIDRLKNHRDSLELDALEIYARLRWRPYLALAIADSKGVIIHAEDGFKILPVFKLVIPKPVKQSA